MSFSETLIPNWSKYVGLGPSDLIRLPGIQSLLLLSGRHEMKIDGYRGLTWSCCGIYQVLINEGGLEAEIIEEPDTSYYREPVPKYDPWNTIEDVSKSLESDLVESYTNPFSWDPITPIILKNSDEGPPGCIYDSELDQSVYSGQLAPLRFTKPVKCSRAKPGASSNSSPLSNFRLKVISRRLSRSIERLEIGDSCNGYKSSSSLTLEGECEIELLTPYYDYKISILYPGSFYKFRMVGESRKMGPLPGLAIGLQTKLAIASRTGVSLNIEPGRIVLSSRGTLRISVGGELLTYRQFIEDLISEWRIIRLPSNGLGNSRTSNGAIMVTGGGKDFIDFAVYNPTDRPGLGEIRLPRDGVEVSIYGPLGETRIPVVGDLARIPISPGFIGSVRVRLSERTVFFRLKRVRKM